MTNEQYMQNRNQEEINELATARPQDVKRIQIKGFLNGDLFSILDPKYKSFQDIGTHENN